MSKQEDSAAYHEVGHITAAVVQAMPIRASALHVDLYGNGCADYFERPLSDLGMTDLDHRERKLSMIALFAAHAAQQRFYPECQTTGWTSDMGKIRAFALQLHPGDPLAQLEVQSDMQKRAEKLVTVHWAIIEELAKTLLEKSCTPLSQEVINVGGGTGAVEHNITGEELVAFFAKHNIKAKIVDDSVRAYDSSQDIPHYDSLA